MRDNWVDSTRYDAFVSYSHGDDGGFAPAFQQQLEAFARQGRAARGLRVFRDDANLAADPDLWHGIERALASSTWLVLLASPQAAESLWVGKEIEWWLANRSVDRILIGLTAGHLAWDAAAGDFDGESTVHPALRGVLRAEPRWIDLRGVRSLAELDDDDPRVQEVLAEFAAPLRGVAKDLLIGAHIRRQRRERRRVRVALAVFMVLFLVAGIAGVVAFVQGQLAEEQARVATARLLASTAVRVSPTDAARANLLAVEGYRLHRDPQTVAALFQVVNDNPELVRQHTLAATATALTASSGGVVLAGTADGRLIRWDPDTGDQAEARVGDRPVTDVAISDDGAVVAATDGTRAVVWREGADPVTLAHEQPGQVALSSRGTTAVVLTAPDAPSQWVSTFDPATGELRVSAELSDFYWDGLGMPDEATIAVTSHGRWLRLGAADLTVTVRQEELMAPTSRGISATSGNGSFTGFHAGWATVFDTATTVTEPGLSGVDSAYTAEVFAIRGDGRMVASSGGGRLFVADVVAVGEENDARELSGAGGADLVAFFGDTDELVTAKGGTLSLWDLAQPSRLRLDHDVHTVPDTPASSAPTRMAVSPDGRNVLLVGGAGEVVRHELLGGTAKGTTVAHSGEENLFPAWFPDGTPVLIGEVGCDLFVVRGDKAETLLAGQGVANVAVRLTSDGQELVCVSEYGGSSTRRVRDGMYFNQMSGQDSKLWTGQVGVAAISDDGRYSAWIVDQRLTVVDNQEGRTVTVPGRSETVDFAGDRLLVSHADGSLDVRDVSGADLRRTIPGDTAFARPLAWVPGTPFVGRIRADGVVVVYDVDTGTALGELPLPASETLANAPWEATAIAGAKGELLAATPMASLVRWAVSEPAWLDLACRFAGRDLRPEEWRAVTGAEPPADLGCRSVRGA